jgi:hypothetical protein
MSGEMRSTLLCYGNNRLRIAGTLSSIGDRPCAAVFVSICVFLLCYRYAEQCYRVLARLGAMHVCDVAQLRKIP